VIFFSFGLPSAFTDWCETILVELVRQKFGAVEFVNANTLEDLGTSVVKTGASHLVCSVRLPSMRLCNLLSEAKTPCLFLCEEPRAAIAHLSASGVDILAATRVVATSCASLTRCAGLPGVLRLDAGAQTKEPLETIRAIGRHFDLGANNADLQKTVDICSTRAVAGPRAIEAWWKKLEEPTRKLIKGATDGYVAYFATGKMGPLTWGRELFLVTDTQQPMQHPIDLTGRGRCLVYGPYIDLPQGSWVAKAVLGCSEDAVNLGLVMDACAAATQLCEAHVRPQAGTIFEVTLKFEIKESDSNPIEIRVFSERAAIDGLLGLGHVALSRELEIHVTKDAALSAELGLQVS
jgi:hypothetical protein